MKMAQCDVMVEAGHEKGHGAERYVGGRYLIVLNNPMGAPGWGRWSRAGEESVR